MPRCRCWPIRVWMDTELNSAVRSRPSTRVSWADFWRNGRGPPRLCRYRGRKPGQRRSHRRRCDQLRRNAIDRARLCSPTPGLPPRLRYRSPRFDAWRMRFDDGLRKTSGTEHCVFRNKSITGGKPITFRARCRAALDACVRRARKRRSEGASGTHHVVEPDSGRPRITSSVPALLIPQAQPGLKNVPALNPA